MVTRPASVDATEIEKGQRNTMRGQRLDISPHPDGSTFTVRALALFFGVSRKRIYNLLYEHRELFGPTMYRQLYRSRGDRRFYRVLSERDAGNLRALFPVLIVK